MDEHELAARVLDIVDEAAYRNAASRVAVVQLAIGGRRVFDLEALQAQFGRAAQGTVAEGAALEVTITPVIHHCRACGHNFPAGREETPCARCGHPYTEPVSGEEIRLLGIAVEEAPSASSERSTFSSAQTSARTRRST